MLKHNKKIFIGLYFVFSVFILNVNSVFSSTLYFSPPSGTFFEGDTFKVSVFVNTSGVAINGVDSSISFPSNFLEVVSVNTSQSIFSMWAEQPKVNSDSISFVGGLPSPGYNGSSGKIFDINFKAKRTGDASLFFPNGVVMANDGLGTNVLKTKQSATFAIKTIQKPVEVIEEVVAPVKKPDEPKTTDDEAETDEPESTANSLLEIKSSTHPDSLVWYNNNNPKFNWTSNKEILAVRLAYTEKANSNPNILYEDPITEKQLDDLPDGEYFFHVQIKTEDGWEETEHFGFKIDKTAPRFVALQKVEQVDKTWPYAKFKIETFDGLSKVDYLEVKINNDASETWRDDGTNIYQTKILNPGENSILFKVFDKAGNYSEKRIDVYIEPLDTPIIEEYSKEVTYPERMVVRGLSYPNGQVLAWVQKDDEEPKSVLVQNNQKGEFVFVSDKKILGGVYTVWFEAVDSRGMKSLASEKLTIIVKEMFVIKIGRQLTELLTIIIPIVSMILVLIWVIRDFLSKIFLKNKRVKKVRRDKVIDIKDEDI